MMASVLSEVHNASVQHASVARGRAIGGTNNAHTSHSAAGADNAGTWCRASGEACGVRLVLAVSQGVAFAFIPWVTGRSPSRALRGSLMKSCAPFAMPVTRSGCTAASSTQLT